VQSEVAVAVAVAVLVTAALPSRGDIPSSRTGVDLECPEASIQQPCFLPSH